MARGRRAGERTAGPRGLVAGGVRTRRALASPRGRRGGGGFGSLGSGFPPGLATSGCPRCPRRGGPRTVKLICEARRSPGAGFPGSAPPPARPAPPRPAFRARGSETPRRAFARAAEARAGVLPSGPGSVRVACGGGTPRPARGQGPGLASVGVVPLSRPGVAPPAKPADAPRRLRHTAGVRLQAEKALWENSVLGERFEGLATIPLLHLKGGLRCLTLVLTWTPPITEGKTEVERGGKDSPQSQN